MTTPTTEPTGLNATRCEPKKAASQEGVSLTPDEISNIVVALLVAVFVGLEAQSWWICAATWLFCMQVFDYLKRGLTA